MKRLKPSDRPPDIPKKLWSAKMSMEGHGSEWGDADIECALEEVIEYLIEEARSRVGK